MLDLSLFVVRCASFDDRQIGRRRMLLDTVLLVVAVGCDLRLIASQCGKCGGDAVVRRPPTFVQAQIHFFRTVRTLDIYHRRFDACKIRIIDNCRG